MKQDKALKRLYAALERSQEHQNGWNPTMVVIDELGRIPEWALEDLLLRARKSQAFDVINSSAASGTIKFRIDKFFDLK